jgi:hypothetical protein
MNYFPTVNPVHRVHVSVDRLGVLGPPWTDAGADKGHGGTLTEAWPPPAPVYGSSPAGGATERGERGELGSGLTGARAALWRPGDSGAEWGGGGAR